MDGFTASVVRAWREDGVDAILIKGPSVASWLYDEHQVRSYGDADLFVEPGQALRARDILVAEGFRARPPAVPEPHSHAVPWVRERDGAQVDLHHSLWDSAASPRQQFAVLRRDAVVQHVGGASVRVPALPARALLVATHAAQHHDHPEGKPREDLRRALAVADLATWRAAAGIAAELGMVAAMARGLCLEPAGAALAGTLPYVGTWMLGTPVARSGAVGFERLATATTAAGRAQVAWHMAFPAPDVMRWWSPMARRGRRGLAVAYAGRLLGLLVRMLPSAWAWRRGRHR